MKSVFEQASCPGNALQVSNALPHDSYPLSALVQEAPLFIE